MPQHGSMTSEIGLSRHARPGLKAGVVRSSSAADIAPTTVLGRQSGVLRQAVYKNGKSDTKTTVSRSTSYRISRTSELSGIRARCGRESSDSRPADFEYRTRYLIAGQARPSARPSATAWIRPRRDCWRCAREECRLHVHRPPRVQGAPASRDPVHKPHTHEPQRQPGDQEADTKRDHDKEHAERHPQQPEPERPDLPAEV
jgi:hypothetical protein